MISMLFIHCLVGFCFVLSARQWARTHQAFTALLLAIVRIANRCVNIVEPTNQRTITPLYKYKDLPAVMEFLLCLYTSLSLTETRTILEVM
jgi:hypothetical protein